MRRRWQDDGVSPEAGEREPMRQCIGCRRRRTKSALLRIVRSPEGIVAVDYAGKAAGRGAYVCSRACFETAHGAHRLERALRTRVTEEEYDAIANAVAFWNEDTNRE